MTPITWLGSLVLAGCVALGAGCAAPYVWVRPETSEAERDRDAYECWARSRALPPQPTVTGRPSRDAAPRQAAYEACLQAKGYTKLRD